MTARKQPGPNPRSGQQSPPATGPDAGDGQEYAGEARGPESEGRWGSADGFDQEAPWGVAEDSPMNEGSDAAAVPPDRRGERRAETPDRTWPTRLGPIEPTRVPEAGPGPAEPGPARRSFPEGTPLSDVPDNSVERQTNMPTRGRAPRGRA